MEQAGGFPGFGGLGRGIQPPLSRRRAVVGEKGVNEKRKNSTPVLLVPLKQIAHALPGWMSCGLSAAPATDREQHSWGRRAAEDAKGEIKNAELPQKY